MTFVPPLTPIMYEVLKGSQLERSIYFTFCRYSVTGIKLLISFTK